ncbi:MAG: J domain-containing protein [Nannocystaceae bacterium]
MAPDLLIIGERDEREDLSERVSSFGYRCAGAEARELAAHLEPPVPAAILLSAQGCDVRAVLRELRRDPQGLGIPVILYSELGGEIRDLADVLELGADRFLVAPVDGEELREALLELLGPSEPTPLAPAPGASDLPLRQRDPLLAQLRRTLAALDERSEGPPAGEGDDVDLDGIGLGGGPGLEGGVAGREISPDLSLIDVEPATRRIARSPRRPSATVRIDDDEESAARARVTLRKAAAASASGELAEEPLPELLARLGRERYTGLLRVRGPGTVDIDWVEGAPADARSDRPELRLSAGLRRRGLVDAEAARSLRERLPADTLADLDAAVEAGAVKARERDALRDELLAEHLTAAFAWEGRWSLHPAAGRAPAARPGLRRSLAAVIVEGALLGLEEPQLRARLGPGELRPRERGPLPSDLEAPPEAVALGALRGGLSVDELAALGGRTLLAWVYGLWVIGCAELVDAAPSEDGAAEAGDEADAALDRRRILARLALARDGDYFALLGRPADASRGELRRAHRDLQRAFADERLEPQTRAELADELAELRAALDEARDVLLDDALRAAYLALAD